MPSGGLGAAQPPKGAWPAARLNDAGRQPRSGATYGAGARRFGFRLPGLMPVLEWDRLLLTRVRKRELMRASPLCDYS